MTLELPFRDAVLLFPLAVVLHVVEEWPGFPRWARHFASPGYSDRAYLLTHAIAIALALAAALLVRGHPTPWLLFAFFAFVFGPGVACNAMFHLGASIITRSYCPGAVTGLLVYLPLAAGLAGLALHERLLAARWLALALAVAIAFHALEVSRNVFARW